MNDLLNRWSINLKQPYFCIVRMDEGKACRCCFYMAAAVRRYLDQRGARVERGARALAVFDLTGFGNSPKPIDPWVSLFAPKTKALVCDRTLRAKRRVQGR